MALLFAAESTLSIFVINAVDWRNRVDGASLTAVTATVKDEKSPRRPPFPISIQARVGDRHRNHRTAGLVRCRLVEIDPAACGDV